MPSHRKPRIKNPSPSSSALTLATEESKLQLAKTDDASLKVVAAPSSNDQPRSKINIRRFSHRNSLTNEFREEGSDAVKSVDFIGPSEAVRHLFSLPYSTDRNVSVALHTIGNGTILIDSNEAYNDSPFASGADEGAGGNLASENTRHSRRRQRPQNWSAEKQLLPTETAGAANDNKLQITQVEQGEKNLLASLALLLEEERQQEFSYDQEAEILSSNACKENRIVQNTEERSKALSIVSSNSFDMSSESLQKNNIPNPKLLSPISISSRPNDDPHDVLAHRLPPPNHYLQNVVSPLTEPSQYYHWKCQDMKLLVASDAIIYKHAPKEFTKSVLSQDAEINPSTNKMKSILLKVADASDLRSKMEHHKVMVEDGLFDRPSYAQALLKNSSTGTEKKEAVNISNSNSFENVKLQTCIIPSSNVGSEWAELGFSNSPNSLLGDFNDPANVAPTENNFSTGKVGENNKSPVRSSSVQYSSSPVCTVLDTYLDSIIANVPQLALILREHGFIQNIKLMRTEDIPSLLMHPSTLGDIEALNFTESSPQPMFSPEIVEMNAAMLLRFLKTNCTRENSTYLLHRSAGDTNLQLFDISSISQLRQRKWIWWLALTSYRFACRLEQLQTNFLPLHDKMTRRDYRKRQRSLLHNTLNLLEKLADMDGGRHDTIGAAVYEHLADTYLWNDEADGDVGLRDSKKPEPLASSTQPYRNITVDCLNKAQDHLMNAIVTLAPFLTKAKDDGSPIELEAVSMQLYGIHHKLINVCLRLADNHLQNYFSSNLVHSLRTAARMLSEATSLIVEMNKPKSTETSEYMQSAILQYSWLWEYCGHFARSFAADELWRERGHTCGNDLLSLFKEVDSFSFSAMTNCLGLNWKASSTIETASHGQVSLRSLTGVVVLPDDFKQIECSVLQKEGCHEAINTAKTIIHQQPEIKRDACLVLVAATMCYSRAIDACRSLATLNENGNDSCDVPLFPTLLCQRLGDTCNEMGKILLKESRQVLSTESPLHKCNRSNNRVEKSHVSAILLISAQFWFVEGLKQFNTGKDLRNIALIRCNLCQCCKIRANSNIMLPGSDNEGLEETEKYLEEAIDHLVLAHDAMGERDTDPMTWDMVSEELAASLLVLGVRRRQSSILGSSSCSPLPTTAFRPSPGVEKSIIEPMERSCKIYESLGNAHAIQQSAAAHYQLAIYFSKVWTCQRDEVKTREKLADAFKHFGISYQYYSSHTIGNEPAFVCLSLDFSNLYSAVSGEECLTKALTICLDCRKAFAPVSTMETKSIAKDWFSQMTTLAANLRDRISKILLSLAKIETKRDENKFKSMYRQVLISRNDKKESQKNEHVMEFDVFFLLNELAESLGSSH